MKIDWICNKCGYEYKIAANIELHRSCHSCPSCGAAIDELDYIEALQDLAEEEDYQQTLNTLKRV